MFNKYLENSKLNIIILPKYYNVLNRQDLNELKELVKIKIKNLKYPLINKSTGYKININSKSIGKILYPAPYFNPFIKDYIINLNASLIIDELYYNAIYVGSLKEMKNNKANNIYHHFISPLRIANKIYKVFITIYNSSLYSISLEFLKTANDSKINVKDLVNNTEIYNYQIKNYELININTMRSQHIIKEDQPIYIG